MGQKESSNNNNDTAGTDEPMRGAEIVLRCLEQHGVNTLFAYPGGASLELHQGLQDASMRIVLPRHEQGAAFEAGGYARATGNVGVCMATSGPGATNLVTGITDAYMDSVPLIAITGQVPQHLIGKNAFQETDIIGMTRPIVKHSYLVLKPEDIPTIMSEAFHLVQTGRPGPVVIDLPKDVQQKKCVPEFSTKVQMRSYRVNTEVSDAEIDQVWEAIENSERPCLYVGGGILTSGAHEELRKFAETNRIPVVTTLMGIGAFPEDSELSMKWLGMHGTYYANYAANECDLLLSLGVRFDDRVTGKVDTFASKAKIVHVDVDQSEINKNKRADIGINCDARSFLKRLNERKTAQDFSPWEEELKRCRKKYPFTYKKRDKIQPQYVIEKIYELTEGEAVVVPGVGQHQMWAGQFYHYRRPRQFLTSGGLGAMGFGLPAAIGAKIACPDATVVNIDGDGSFQMNIQELATAHCEGVGVKSVILNNQHLGMVAQWEDRFYDSRRGNTLMHSIHVDRPYPNFKAIAGGYEVPAREVRKPEELEPALKEMLQVEGPFVVDVHIQYEEHVLPMIPSGGTYKDIMLE